MLWGAVYAKYRAPRTVGARLNKKKECYHSQLPRFIHLPLRTCMRFTVTLLLNHIMAIAWLSVSTPVSVFMYQSLLVIFVFPFRFFLYTV